MGGFLKEAPGREQDQRLREPRQDLQRARHLGGVNPVVRAENLLSWAVSGRVPSGGCQLATLSLHLSMVAWELSNTQAPVLLLAQSN